MVTRIPITRVPPRGQVANIHGGVCQAGRVHAVPNRHLFVFMDEGGVRENREAGISDQDRRVPDKGNRASRRLRLVANDRRRPL